MPKIPQYESRIPVKSIAPTTGLQPARMESPVPQAIGQLGQVIGNIGEIVYTRAKQQQAEFAKIFDVEVENKLITEHREDELTIMKSEGIDSLAAYDQLIKRHDESKKKLSDYLKGGEDTFGFGYLGERVRQNLSEEDKTLIIDNVNQYFLKRQSAFNGKLATAYQYIKNEGKFKMVEGMTVALTDGTTILEQALVEVDKNAIKLNLSYEDKRAVIQTLTKTALEKGLDDENPQMVMDIKAGKYNDELGDEKLIDYFRDKAKVVGESIMIESTYNEGKVIFGHNFEAWKKSVQEDNKLSADIKKGIITKIGLDERIYEDEIKTNSKKEYGILQKSLYENKYKNLKSFRNAVLSAQYLEPRGDYGKHSILTEAEHWFNDPDLRQTNPYDNKHTDMGYFSKMMGKALSGEIKPDDEDIQPKPFKLGIGHSKIIQEAAEGKYKDVEGFLKREIKNGRARILKGIAGQIGMFDPLSVRKANEYESALTETISKAKNKEEMKEMLTPESPKYIGDELVERFTPTIQDMKEDAIKSQKRLKGNVRQEGETIQQFEDKKKKGKTDVKPSDADAVLRGKAIDALNNWNAKPENKNKKIKINDENIRKTIEYQREKGR